MDDTLVFLVPVGSGRFELYSEPPDDHPPVAGEGFFKKTLHRANEKWRETVHTARRGDTPTGRFAQWRDWAVCRVAEMVAEQRTLWSLRNAATATLVYPADMSDRQAASTRDRLLARARRHHGRWLVIDGLLFVGSGIFMLVPGPNLLAYYFGVRVLGHYLSWRGAGQAIDRTTWGMGAEPALAELGQLADVPRETRALRVAAIAERLNLPRLAAFFERTAVHVR